MKREQEGGTAGQWNYHRRGAYEIWRWTKTSEENPNDNMRTLEASSRITDMTGQSDGRWMEEACPNEN
jgi:hypothetical protein